MKTTVLQTAIFALTLGAGAMEVRAQVQPHSFGLPERENDTIAFPLQGNTPLSVRPFFDIYPIQTSTNLSDWQTEVLLIRTNASTNTPVLAVHRPVRRLGAQPAFYRTPTNHFVTPLPQPTGPYAVGVFDRLLTDTSRSNRYGIKTNSSFMASIWYPAENRAAFLPTEYVHEKFVERFGSYFENPAAARYFRAFADTSCRPLRSARWPVILYSPGYTGHRRSNSGKCEELASYGYLVIVIDHEDAYGTVFLDGRFISGRYVDEPTITDVTRAYSNRVADVKFVLDLLPIWDAADPILQGMVDLGRIGMMGFSLGVGTVAGVTLTDSRCRVLALLDGYFPEVPALRTNQLRVPVLQMYQFAAESLPGFDTVQRVYTNASSSAYYCQVRGTDHISFRDLVDPSHATVAYRRAEEAVRACVVSFFNKHLLDRDDHILDNPTNHYPVLFKFKSK